MVTSLRSLLRVGRPAQHPVAFAGAGGRTWRDFEGHVAALCRRLDSLAGERWVVFLEDSYAFAVALLALAQRGRVAVLPPNGQPGTLSRFCESADGAVFDTVERGAAVGATVPVVAALQQPVPAEDWSDLDPDASLIEFFTSGTTGDSKRIAKRLRHLDDEVAVLDELFGGDCAAARVVATASHQHIYGSLFRVFWPLAAGRSFSARTYLHGTEVAAAAEGATALVSTPVQLKAMAIGDTLRELPLSAVFSSGAPLEGETAAAVFNLTGIAVTEVFGSTETGGVGWRRRQGDVDAPWQVLPGVQVRAGTDGGLEVSSPFVSAADGDWFAMGDRVELVAGGFRLGARMDRIVKIASKRLSLPEMERDLCLHDHVAEAALVVERRGMEERVCAAVVPSQAGRVALDELGKVELSRALGDHLAGFFDRVLLPRAWRFVDALPRSAQGKLPASAVRALFGAQADSPVLEPIVEAESTSDGVIERRCVVPSDLAYFEGHFDSFPIVAGVVQLRWVVEAARALSGEAPRVAAIEGLKFKQPLTPGDRFEMRVEHAGGKIRFAITRDGETLSCGRLVLG